MPESAFAERVIEVVPKRFQQITQGAAAIGLHICLRRHACLEFNSFEVGLNPLIQFYPDCVNRQIDNQLFTGCPQQDKTRSSRNHHPSPHPGHGFDLRWNIVARGGFCLVSRLAGACGR